MCLKTNFFVCDVLSAYILLDNRVNNHMCMNLIFNANKLLATFNCLRLTLLRYLILSTKKYCVEIDNFKFSFNKKLPIRKIEYL